MGISLRKLFRQGGPGSGFEGHEGRPGEVGGSVPESGSTPGSSKKVRKPNHLGWSPPAKFEKYDLPLQRPDYSPITSTPDRDSARRSLRVGIQAYGNYSPASGFGQGSGKTVRGEIIGFVNNHKNHPGGSSGDVVIFDEKNEMLYFVASRNVFSVKRKK
jgi:hypothetical protein